MLKDVQTALRKCTVGTRDGVDTDYRPVRILDRLIADRTGITGLSYIGEREDRSKL